MMLNIDHWSVSTSKPLTHKAKSFSLYLKLILLNHVDNVVEEQLSVPETVSSTNVLLAVKYEYNSITEVPSEMLFSYYPYHPKH